MMKIWYQSMTKVSAWPAYNVALREVISSVCDAGTEFEVHGIEGAGGVGDQYRYLEFIETQEVLANVERATREGFDAFLIGNIADPGLREAREITENFRRYGHTHMLHSARSMQMVRLVDLDDGFSDSGAGRTLINNLFA
jgi:allantoin racemase